MKSSYADGARRLDISFKFQPVLPPSRRAGLQTATTMPVLKSESAAQIRKKVLARGESDDEDDNRSDDGNLLFSIIAVR